MLAAGPSTGLQIVDTASGRTARCHTCLASDRSDMAVDLFANGRSPSTGPSTGPQTINAASDRSTNSLMTQGLRQAIRPIFWSVHKLPTWHPTGPHCIVNVGADRPFDMFGEPVDRSKGRSKAFDRFGEAVERPVEGHASKSAGFG